MRNIRRASEEEATSTGGLGTELADLSLELGSKSIFPNCAGTPLSPSIESNRHSEFECFWRERSRLQNWQMQTRLHQEFQRVDLHYGLSYQRRFAFFQRNQKGQV